MSEFTWFASDGLESDIDPVCFGSVAGPRLQWVEPHVACLDRVGKTSQRCGRSVCIRLKCLQKAQPIYEMHNRPISEGHSQPISKGHNQPVSERHNQPIFEGHNQPISDRYSKPISERHKNPNSQTHSQLIRRLLLGDMAVCTHGRRWPQAGQKWADIRPML